MHTKFVKKKKTQPWPKKDIRIKILKKYKQIRLNALLSNLETRQSNLDSQVSRISYTEMKKKDIMKLIIGHNITDDMNDTFAQKKEFDFQKQKSGFNLPIYVCKSGNHSKKSKKYIDIDRYFQDRTNEFKRTVAENLFTNISSMQRKDLHNYSPFLDYERHAKKFPNRKRLCSSLVSNHLTKTIAARRASWINVFFYKFHVIQDLAKSLMAKHALANARDKNEALLGMRCHQRGVEPFFPSTAFISGKGYNYSTTKDKTEKFTNHENKQLEDTNHSRDVKDNEIIKHNLYECTDDCIRPKEQDCKSFHNLLHTLSHATDKNIRNKLHDYDYCSNIQANDIYLLPCEKRNHPRICYECQCESSSVPLRKLAIHHKNCRKFINILTDLNMAHKFIHDIDVATVIGDIAYLIKLVALQPTKQPSILSYTDCPHNDVEDLDVHVSNYKTNCLDILDIACDSCDILELAKNIRKHKDSWVNIKNNMKNNAWICLK